MLLLQRCFGIMPSFIFGRPISEIWYKLPEWIGTSLVPNGEVVDHYVSLWIAWKRKNTENIGWIMGLRRLGGVEVEELAHVRAKCIEP